MANPKAEMAKQKAAQARAEKCEAEIGAILRKYRCAFSPRVLYEADRQTIAKVEITVKPLALE